MPICLAIHETESENQYRRRNITRAFPVQGVQKAVQRLTQCLRRPGLLGGGSGQAALQLYQGEIPAFIPPLGVIMAVAVQGYIPGNPADKGQQGIGPVGRDGVP